MNKLKKLISTCILGLSLTLATVPAFAVISTDSAQTLSAVGNGVTTNYTIGFPFQSNSQLKVYLQNQTTLAETEVTAGGAANQYTVTGGNPGTTVVMGTAPTSNFKVLIKRDTPRTQTVDYVPNQVFPADAHETQMDKQVQMIQEVRRDLTTVQGSTNSATADALSADPTDCAAGTKATGIDEQGNLTCSAVSMTADVSGVLPKANGGTGVNLTTTALELPEVSTPSTPSSGFGKIYFKNDNKLYQVNDAGTESQVGSGSGGLPLNTLNGLNGDFEQGTASWTASGGTWTSTTAAANILPPSTTAGSWDSDGASQTLSSSTLTITSGDGISGQNITGSMYLKCATGTCTHKLQLFDGTNVLAESTINSNTSSFTPTSVTGVAPASGSLILRLISVASNEPIIYTENAYRGRADGFNLSQVSQASMYGALTYAGTTSCTWSRTSNASFADYSADTDCPTPSVVGNASAPGTKIPAITFSSMAPGDYLFVATGFFRTDANGANCAFRFSDGTNHGSPQQVWSSGTSTGSPTLSGRLSYTDAATRTISIQGTGTDSNVACVIDTSVANTEALNIRVYRFPSSSELAYRPDLAVQWGGISVATSASDTPGGTGAWEAPSNASWATKTLLGSATAGTTANELSFRMPYLAAGSYEVITNYQIRAANSSNCHMSVFDGTTRFGVATASNGVANGEDNVNLGAGIITYSSAQTNKEFTIQFNGDSTSNCTLYGGLLSGSGPRQFFIKPVGVSVPAPLLVGSVTSNSSGLERVERLRFTNSGTPTIAQQSGSWVGSLSDNGVGLTTINIASSIFSQAPVCVCSASLNGGGETCKINGTPTATAVQIQTKSESAGALTNSDLDANVICMGPR